MIEIIVGTLLLLSAVIVLIASIGIIRFRDLYARIHVVTKVSSFGLMLLLIAMNLLYQKITVLIESIIVFHVLIFLSPVSAHVIAKITRWLSLQENDTEKESDDEQKKVTP